MSMHEPGLDRHDWESRLETLEDDLRSEPERALAEVADLVEEMLVVRGYHITHSDDPAAAADEREVVAAYRAAREVSDRVERGETVDPGDVGSAVQGLLAIADGLIGRPSD